VQVFSNLRRLFVPCFVGGGVARHTSEVQYKNNPTHAPKLKNRLMRAFFSAMDAARNVDLNPSGQHQQQRRQLHGAVKTFATSEQTAFCAFFNFAPLTPIIQNTLRIASIIPFNKWVHDPSLRMRIPTRGGTTKSRAETRDKIGRLVVNTHHIEV
jgi:hypothetical protein